ncbi:S1 family peptidase [Demetria terragena]|uniref:S1 family peptidase n=1 Tax=Demetria terragena TaxID=63959 RepID=UPI0003670596|nr:trypsin-like serine protease [Demetria terragena]
MKKFALGAATAALAITGLTVPTASAVDGPDRIVGGTTATSNPGTVALFVNGAYNCTATLLDSNSVLTAKHCIGNGSASALSFRVGSLSKGSGGTIHKASKVTWHSADLAVATLATPATGAPTVRLATARPAANETNKIFGWGGTTCAEFPPSPATLKTANVRVQSLTSDNYGGIAFKSTGINGTAWKGDSGGPQFNAAGQQVGVASTADCYSVQNYTSVPDYRSWITTQAAG